MLISEGSKIMQIKDNSDERGNKRLGEQENKANRVSKAPERGPDVLREERKRAQKGYGGVGAWPGVVILVVLGPP